MTQTSLANAAAKFRVGLVQLCATRNPDENTLLATKLIRQAANEGAQYIQTPEVTTLMETDPKAMLAVSQPEESNTSLDAFRSLAAELSVWLHIGSIGIKVSDTKLANRSFVIAPDGNIAARYDKIHMFDVILPNEERYDESRNFEPGVNAVSVDLPWGRLGLTICYDLRFAYLHRALAHAGAQFLAVPAAFTRTTGEAHWHTLLKARAIETGCFVFAAGQTGDHDCGRQTFGHSLVVSPWGEILTDGGTSQGVVVADIDVGRVTDVRRQIPALNHDRTFE
ncbi:MAG: carbon-nitrogen hydrolase family protein [Hyphomicrobiaceae bacterium]